MRNRAITACIIFLFCAGCAVPQVANDQDRLRGALLDLYTNQVMDNLIRTYNCMPIIQVDYTNAQGMVTVAASGTFGENQTVTNSTVTAIPALTQAVTRTISTMISGSLSASNTNQITLSAAPLITADEVYDAYVAFVYETKYSGTEKTLAPTGKLVVTPDTPPPGAAHICRQYCKQYYWVPVEHRAEFLNLALVTTAQRGKTLEPPVAYSVNVIDAIQDSPLDPKTGTDPLLWAVLKLDTSIPNDSGGPGNGFFFSNASKSGGSSPAPAPQTKSLSHDPTNLPELTLAHAGDIEVASFEPCGPTTRPAGELGQVAFQAAPPAPGAVGPPAPVNPPAPAPGGPVNPIPSSAPSQGFGIELFVDPRTHLIPAKTNLIRVELTQSAFRYLTAQLAQSGSVPAKIVLDHRRPATPTAADLLQQLNFEARQTNQILNRVGL
jgi:hypothetical protein